MPLISNPVCGIEDIQDADTNQLFELLGQFGRNGTLNEWQLSQQLRVVSELWHRLVFNVSPPLFSDFQLRALLQACESLGAHGKAMAEAFQSELDDRAEAGVTVEAGGTIQHPA